MAKENIVLHVYKVQDNPEEIKFDKLKDAIDRAYREFEKNNVYKCKIWDLTYGTIEPNNPNAPALVFELV